MEQRTKRAKPASVRILAVSEGSGLIGNSEEISYEIKKEE